ncbi:hypothetical protein ALO36_103544 [Pseudomonas syringae pv. tomato]|uniref:Uncharacterized protein n=1 Tax=Pseudomonas syringae pv. maculicola TaxID=59511 RepID=A0A0N0WUN6_PSEYM|nr:Unknown protein sequence [Pseudomonas syringae pv. maculicola str. M6]KPB99073.1 Unknown protein sequence [Pseudomonas syringae pv. maculicola]KPX77068.1 hypothetical protein ALO84_101982 [Pseudomonas syringae pv. maculicola]KPY90697.1 hypothetical protein ALO36_103544 [Pseudomonas syringae pv. tomato]RML41880.1 hypothetical protein APX70_02908 [Pseudomonas syringae pv. maculicola]
MPASASRHAANVSNKENRAKMPSTQAASGHFQRIALFAECIFDLPLTRGKLIGAS